MFKGGGKVEGTACPSSSELPMVGAPATPGSRGPPGRRRPSGRALRATQAATPPPHLSPWAPPPTLLRVRPAAVAGGAESGGTVKQIAPRNLHRRGARAMGRVGAEDGEREGKEGREG